MLGEAFTKALADKKGIRRFGSSSVPMEDVVAEVTADLSGRGFFKGISLEPGVQAQATDPQGYGITSANHFFESLAKKMGLNLSIRITGNNPDLHTNLEPVFKALGLALDQATQIDPRRKGVPSTKGVID